MFKILFTAVFFLISYPIFAIQLTTYNSMMCPDELYYSNKGSIISRDRKWIEMEQLPNLDSTQRGNLIQQQLLNQFPIGDSIEIELKRVMIGSVFAQCLYAHKGSGRLIYLYTKGPFVPTNSSWVKFNFGTIQYECGSLQGTITFDHCLFKPANEPTGTEISK